MHTAFHYSASMGARHRYGIWQMLTGEWVGFGMSSMSFLGSDIFFNDRSIHSYIDKTMAGDLETGEGNHLGLREHMRFAFLYGLRLRHYPRSAFATALLAGYRGRLRGRNEALLEGRRLAATVDDDSINA